MPRRRWWLGVRRKPCKKDFCWPNERLRRVPRWINWTRLIAFTKKAERVIVILDQILEHKKAELRHKNSRGYLADLKNKIRDAGPTMGFAVTLDARRTAAKPALIAEVKKASPSLGLLRPEFAQRFEPVTIAEGYRDARRCGCLRADG